VAYVWDEELERLVFRFVETLDNELIDELFGRETRLPTQGRERFIRG